MISDQSTRDRIVTDLWTSLAVDAGAGTGKTTLLLDRLMAILLKEKIHLPRIAAITFTEKAAGELMERLRDKLGQEFEKLKDSPEKEEIIRRALQELEMASVSTIHSFCASILREYPVEAGVDPRFSVLDQVQRDTLENQTWENWLKKALADRVEELMTFFKLGASFSHIEELKAHLLKNQSLLTRPKALPMPEAQEVVYLLEKNWKLIQTLRKSGKDGDKLTEELHQYEKDWQAILSLEESSLVFSLIFLEIPKNKSGNQKNWKKEDLAQVREYLTRMKEDQNVFASKVKNAVLQSILAWIWDYLEIYSQTKAEKGLLDFDDLLLKTRDLLKNNKEVREELKERFDRLFIDEFQDTDPLQVEIVFFLSEKKKTHSMSWQDVNLEMGKLFIVGDPQQSIYRFRRANVEIYGKAKMKLLDSGGKVEKLTENFRTLSPIVQWVNEGFEKIFQNGPIPYNVQNAHRTFKKNPQQLEPLIGLEIPELPNEEQTADGFRKIEAYTLAAWIDQILREKWEIQDARSLQNRPVQAGDIAILFRELSNTEAVYEEALRLQGLPFQIVGGKKFYNRPEIVILETLLSCLESPADETGLVALLRSSLFGFTDEQLFLYREEGGTFHFLKKGSAKIEEAFQLLREWHSQIRNLSPSEVLLYLYEHTNLLAVAASQPHGEQRVANLMKVVDQCRDLETSQNFTYRAFVKWLSRQREEDAIEGEAPGPEVAENQITLMTLHKAKGLEFPVVLLSGSAQAKSRSSEFIVNPDRQEVQFKTGNVDLELWTENYEKASTEENTQNLAETLRLLYVGCTRARESLILPLAPPGQGGAFLESITTQFNLAALKRMKVTLTPGKAISPALVVDLNSKDQKKIEVQTQKAFLQKLKEDQKALIEKRRGQSPMTSVTQLVHSQDDKAIREEYGLSGERTATYHMQSEGKALGVLTHQLLEKGWNWDPKTILKAALLWAPALGLSTPRAQEAAQWASQALTHPLLLRGKKATRVFRELPLTGKTDEGIFLNAVIDLAFVEGSDWVVVDYKTDRDIQKGLASYQKQMGYYCELLKTFTKMNIKESYLYFLHQNLVLQVPSLKPFSI